jgi:hypothetical protein
LRAIEGIAFFLVVSEILEIVEPSKVHEKDRYPVVNSEYPSVMNLRDYEHLRIDQDLVRLTNWTDNTRRIDELTAIVQIISLEERAFCVCENSGCSKQNRVETGY